MIVQEPYNHAVRAFFENPAHAGDVQGDYPKVITATTAESEQGARIVLSLAIADGMIAEMRFRVSGCPHLIAAAESICSDCEKGPVSGLIAWDMNATMQHLAVPPEKTGKMLLLEDALKSLWEQHQHAA